MKYEYTVQGVDYEVEIEDVDGNIAKVSVNGIPFEVEMKQPIKAAPKVKKVEAPKPQKPHLLPPLQLPRQPHQPPLPVQEPKW